jgi:hypothetical protein
MEVDAKTTLAKIAAFEKASNTTNVSLNPEPCTVNL